MTATRLARWTLATLALAAVVHFAAIWALPRVITGIFMQRLVQRAGANHVVLTPMPTSASREVVKPSPDLLYAACVFDVTAGPVLIRARPPDGYWSLSLFAANSDNIFKINDQEAKGQPVEVIVAPAGLGPGLRQSHPTAIVVDAPSTRGVVLTRSLVLDPADMAGIESSRAETRCEPMP